MDARSTERTRRRYGRIARIYDLMEVLPEIRYRSWRERLWREVTGPAVLEVGVGTGKNIPFYAPGLSVTAIELTPLMLERARRKSAALGSNVTLSLGDVQELEFPGGSFDDVVASFVFCSVPDPVLGLANVRRVLRPGGQLSLLEHVRAKHSVIGRMMDFANPLCVRLSGANINRRTVENVERAGLSVESVEDVGFGGLFKLIRARNG